MTSPEPERTVAVVYIEEDEALGRASKMSFTAPDGSHRVLVGAEKVTIGWEQSMSAPPTLYVNGHEVEPPWRVRRNGFKVVENLGLL